MPSSDFDKLLKRNMSRREFLGFTVVAGASIFGVIRIISELKSFASGASFGAEAESGVLGNGAKTIGDGAASGGSAVKFGTPAPTPTPTPPPGGGSNLTQPNWTKTVVMTNLSTSSSDNTGAFQAYLSGAAANTKFVFPNNGPAQYTFSQNIDIHVANVGVFGGTSNAADTVILSTSQTNHGYRVYANNHFIKNFTHKLQRSSGTGRSDQNEQGASTLLIETAVDGFKGEDLVLDSAAAAGFFAYGATNYSLNRVVSQNSLADSFHNTRGCTGGQFTDCTARNGGDDGFAVIQYGADPTSFVSSNITFTRCKTYNSAARGFAAVCVHDITYVDCYAESSVEPGVYIAREGNNTNPQDCYNITSTGTFILKSCGSSTNGRNGSFFFTNYDATGKVRNVNIAKCAIINAPTGQYASVRAVNYDISGNAGAADSGVINATLNNFSFYGTNAPNVNGTPSVYENVAGSSSNVVLNNWPGLASIGNNYYTATIQPLSAAPTPA